MKTTLSRQQADSRSSADVTPSSSHARSFAAPATVVQRREHLGDTKELSENETDQQKKALGGTEPQALKKEVKEDALNLLRKSLMEIAQEGIEQYNQNRNNKIDLGKNTDYDAVLQVGINKVLAKYGKQINEAKSEAKENASSTLSDRKNDIGLHQADSRWDALKNNKQKVKQEAGYAMQYMVDTNNTLVQLVDKIKEEHPDDDVASVQQGYVNALLKTNDEKLFDLMAEYRVRWSPVTEEEKIYFETPKKKKNILESWTFFRYILHEVMHTASHAKFEKYLDEEAPASVSNTIREGTVDYFTQVVWKEIVESLKGNLESDDIATIQKLGGGSRKLNMLKTLIEYVDKAIYPGQVETISKAVKSLDDGEKRLAAAFFYGDVYHFFPRYKKQEEVKSENIISDDIIIEENLNKVPEIQSPPKKKNKQLELKTKNYIRNMHTIGQWDEEELLSFKTHLYQLVNAKEVDLLSDLHVSLAQLHAIQVAKFYKEHIEFLYNNYLKN